MNPFIMIFGFTLYLLVNSETSNQILPERKSTEILPDRKSTDPNQKQKKFNVPKIIWTYYHTGLENAGLFNQKCYHHNLKVFKNSGWELRFLSDETLKLYINITQVDEYMQKGKDVWPQTKSDLIRMLLLRDFGGVWTDASTYFLQDLQWLENIHENPYLQTKFDGFPEVFALTNSLLDSDRRNYPRKWIHNGSVILPNIQSWFLAAIPNSKFLKDWTKAFKEIGSMDSETMGSELRNKGYELSAKQSSSYFKVYASKTMILTDKQKQLNKQSKEGMIKQRRTAVEDYKLWTMESSIGPLLHEAMSVYELLLTMNNLLKYQEKDVFAYRRPKYLIKIPGFVKMMIMNELTKSKTISQMTIKTCLTQYYMIKHSIFYNLLTENGQEDLLQKQNIKSYHYDEIPLICHHLIIHEVVGYLVIIVVSGIGFISVLISQSSWKGVFLKLQGQDQIWQDMSEGSKQTIQTSKVQTLEQVGLGINLSIHFADISIAVIVWGLNTFCLYVSLIKLKYIEIFVYIQFVIICFLTLLLYKVLANILLPIDRKAKIKYIWKKRASVLVFIVFQLLLYQQLKRYYYQPNTSVVPEMMIGCVTVTKYFISISLYLTIYFLFMQEILIERNLFKFLKQKLSK